MEPFSQKSNKVVENIGDLILSDVWGLAQVEGPGHEYYFFSYIDFKSRFLGIYFGLMKKKALKHFTMFKEFIKMQTGNKVKKTLV